MVSSSGAKFPPLNRNVKIFIGFDPLGRACIARSAAMEMIFRATIGASIRYRPNLLHLVNPLAYTLRVCAADRE